MPEYEHILIESPATGVRQIILNRPEKRNAISTPMRTEILEALRTHDTDDDVRVTIISGAGKCFSSGYDLTSGGLMKDSPMYSAPGDGQWTRQATDTWFSIWDLAKPVIAQIHGFAMAGGTELASACDLIYMADDATIGYPVVRVMSTPDWQFHTPILGLRASMEMMLTGNTYTAQEAVQVGFANRAYPASELEAEVLSMAETVARVPSDLQQVNKRSVHRSFEVLGGRTAIRAAQELQALAAYQESVKEARKTPFESIKKAFD
ncbi:MAG: enoyl-CoA hydratase [Acidimicrobiaceae bacterium]|nr:enoyl-CoA hydratase [Acidimicrobiaceae bacterium]